MCIGSVALWICMCLCLHNCVELLSEFNLIIYITPHSVSQQLNALNWVWQSTPAVVSQWLLIKNVACTNSFALIIWNKQGAQQCCPPCSCIDNRFSWLGVLNTKKTVSLYVCSMCTNSRVIFQHLAGHLARISLALIRCMSPVWVQFQSQLLSVCSVQCGVVVWYRGYRGCGSSLMILTLSVAARSGTVPPRSVKIELECEVHETVRSF